MKKKLLLFIPLSFAAFIGCEQQSSVTEPLEAQSSQILLVDDDNTALEQAESDAFKARMRKLATQYQAKSSRPAGKSRTAIIQGSKITVPDDFPTIQEAVDNAAPGTKIKIKDKATPYAEDITIMTADLRLTGEGNPVVAGNISIISTSGVKLDNFTIKGTNTLNGIDISDCSEITIKDMTIDADDHGIRIQPATDCLIKGNTITGGTCEAIHILDTDDCDIQENILRSNGDDVIELDNSNGNEIVDNDARFASSEGLEMDNSNNNEISDNDFSHANNEAIELDNCDDNEIGDNKCNNSNCGIDLGASTNGNEVTDNECNDNSNIGIDLSSDASDNEIGLGNEANNNGNRGIRLRSGTSNNTVEDNQACGNTVADITDLGTDNDLNSNETGCL